MIAIIRNLIPRPIRLLVPASIRSLIPKNPRFNRYQAYAWKRIREYPQRITLTTFVPTGCQFEVTSLSELVRVRNLASEEEFIRLLLEEIRPGDICFDIGSCIGMHALHAALCGAKVVAFEPDQSYRRRLKRNIAINKLAKSIKVVGWAVSDQKGTATLYTDGVKGHSPSLHLAGQRGAIRVPTDTIDNALMAGQLPTPTLVKMDIEGAEMLALRGMRRLLGSSHAPRALFLELHPTLLPAAGSSVDACMDLLTSAGYKQDYAHCRNDQFHYIYRKQPHGSAD